MCGIVGYIGNKDVGSVVLVGLEKLEYRGYDSAGIAAVEKDGLFVKKKMGRLSNLYALLENRRIDGHIAIGHTRWATHGRPSDENAHPHTDCKNQIAVAHNGIIENFKELRSELESKGHKFLSETDSEVIPHLIEEYYDGSLFDAVLKAIQRLEGAFAIAVVSSLEPDVLIGARKDSPLIVGVGDGEMLLASDIPAIVSHTHRVIILDNGEIAVLKKDGYQIFDFNGQKREKAVTIVDWDAKSVELEGFPHFMLKEIFEQPHVIEANLHQYLRNNEFMLLKDTNLRRLLMNKRSILIEACGTSFHAGMVGRYLIEKLAKIDTRVEFASEFRYREPVIDQNVLIMAISQSGETADTLAGVRLAKEAGLEVLSIVNVRDSSIARESDYVIYTNAGPEIGVASTKAYTAQILILTLLALELAVLKGHITEEDAKGYADELRLLPGRLAQILEKDAQIQHLAEKYYNFNNFMFLGRGINYPTALEGALKLKEISYIHATGYASGEMKHGPIALVDENMPVVFVNPKTSVYEKALSNMKEIEARGGRIISVVTEGDEKAPEISTDVFYIPKTDELLTPIVSIVPLQLFAYHVAVLRGCDVDKPRNLAKSVTVE
ncbi:MAG: glutamine--fructose-6-phosphate transaminase (isomerizing) [Candidatus Hydrothermota bacterium]|nr:MAG: glutamine--fructose-6-phosphate transaminase (isomerizing) [Candidatus Hydrothermae bacterium]